MRVHLYQRDSKLLSNRMELSTGTMVQETSPLRVQEIEIRHTKQSALLSWSRNTSGGKTVKFFLGGCWCALPVRPEICSLRGGVCAVQMRQSGAGVHHLHYHGPNYNQKYQMYLLHSFPCELWKQKDRSFLCCGLPVCIWRNHSLCRHRLICCHKGINQRELTRTRQVCPGASESVIGKKIHSRYRPKVGDLCCIKQCTDQLTKTRHFICMKELMKMQQSDLSL